MNEPLPPTLGRRLFAWAMARGQGWSDRVYASRKRSLFADLAGNVLEIGAGTGSNLEFLPAGVHWTGVEPNPCMHPYALRRAVAFAVDATMVAGQGERIEADDGSFDAVIVTLVLCSVRDPVQVVSEARRLLRPGGTFVFIEHVAAPPGSAIRKRQDCIQPLWSWLSGGCHPNRDTGVMIATAGFAALEVEHFDVPSPGGVVTPQIAGIAVR